MAGIGAIPQLWDGTPAIPPKKRTVVGWPQRPKRTTLNSSGHETDVLVNRGILMRIDRQTTNAMLALCAGLGVMVTACTQTAGSGGAAFDEACGDDCEVGTTGNPDPHADGEPDAATTGHDADPDGGDGDDDGTGRADDDGDRDPDGDDGSGTSDPASCCEAEEQTCLDGGETSSVCGSIREICETDACEQLMGVCDPTTVPVSHGCARAYYACFGFRINKCRRTNYDQCVSALGDTDICAAWDASCASRETYCNELLCTGTESEDSEDFECHLEYECTDWGHAFDPCWEDYLACSDDAATCEQAFHVCGHARDIYDAWSCEGGGDEPTDGGETGDSGDSGDSGDPAG